MSDVGPPTRRTLPVVILDAALSFAAALQSGHLPWTSKRRPSAQRSTVLWMAAAAAMATAGTVTLVVVFLNFPGGLAPLGGASPPPAAAPQAPTRTVSPTATAAPSTAAPSPTPTPTPTPHGPDRAGQGDRTPAAPRPPAQPLTARYSSEESQGLLAYQAEVTINNPRPRKVDGWRLVITLPRSTLTVTDVSGATARQNDSTWTFTPTAGTATIPAGRSVRVSFQVRGATLVAAEPIACTINGRRCAGLP